MKKYYVILLVLSYSAAFADGIHALDKFLKNKKSTITAQFKQTVISHKGGQNISKISYGDMQIARPGKFNWVYRDDSESGAIAQRIVSDGKNIYIYDIALQQVTTKELDNTVTGSPAAILAGGNNLKKYYTITNIASKDNDLLLVDLKPKLKASDNTMAMQDAILGFNKDTNKLQYMQLIDTFGNVSKLQFKALKTNVKLAAANFKFVMPAGVDIN